MKKNPLARLHTLPNDELKGVITRLSSAGEKILAQQIEKILSARPQRKERTYKTPPDGGTYNKFQPAMPSWIPGKDCWRNGNDPRCKERAKM